MIKKFNIFLRVLTGAVLVCVVGCASGVKIPEIAKCPLPPVQSMKVPDGSALPDQEKLVYHVKWLGITAGEIVAEIKGHVMWKDRPCYLIDVSARTVGFAASIYKVDDHYTSYLDAEKYYTLRHEERRHEGGFQKNAVTDFDHTAGKAYFTNATDGSHKVFDIPAGVQDTVTAAYAARLLPLEAGKVFAFKVSNSEKIYDLYATVTQRTKIPYGGLEVNTLHLVPFASINGCEVREGRVSGFLSDDKRKIPLLVVIKAPVFTQVTATLVP